MEYSFKLDSDSIVNVVNKLSRKKRNLNNWENMFIISIDKLITEKGVVSLSDKQLEKLSDLWEKY